MTASQLHIPAFFETTTKNGGRLWQKIQRLGTSIGKICTENVHCRKQSRKFCRRRSRSSNHAMFGHFTVLFCSEIQWPKTHLQGYCSTHQTFCPGDVLVHVVVVVCLKCLSWKNNLVKNKVIWNAFQNGRRMVCFYKSFLVPEVFNFFLLCKLGTYDVTSSEVWGSKHKIIKNISGNNCTISLTKLSKTLSIS